MKKNSLTFRKVICTFLAILSLAALLTSPVTFKIDDAKDFASDTIENFANSKKPTAMSMAANAAINSGLKDDLVKELPKKVSLSESYLSLYHLVVRYRENQKLKSSDLKLPAKNSLQKFLSEIILYLVNSELKQHESELQQITQIYQLSLWVVCFLYILGVALLIFNRHLSWLPVLLGSASAFGFQVFICNYLTKLAQQEVYSKIWFNYSWRSVAGFAIALILVAFLFYQDWQNWRGKEQKVKKITETED
ncbi:hypothetical protein [Lactobacillus sp.]|uniref:hypothetical protein n=1 Tax=Lactobacillus sp. TaxID=1591 RepID=UPI003EF84B07